MTAGEKTREDVRNEAVMTGWPATQAGTAYQLMSARVAPESFTPIQAPPPGSEGNRASRLPSRCRAGSKAATRVRFSSRFIPSA